MTRGGAPIGRDGLTDRQRRFVEAYCGEAHMNASAAAEMAGYEASTRNTFGAIGHENLKKPKIRAAIDAFLGAHTLNDIEILSGLTSIAKDPEQHPPSRVRSYELLGKARRLWDKEAPSPPPSGLSMEQLARLSLEDLQALRAILIKAASGGQP